MANSQKTDEMANIEALVKLNRADEAKTRADKWAESEPHNFRAHLSQALCEVSFFNYDPIELYFNRKKLADFYNYVKNAQTVASESQCVEIYNTIKEYLNFINEIIKLHPVISQLKEWETVEDARLRKEANGITEALQKKTNEVNDSKQKLQIYSDDLQKNMDRYDSTKATLDKAQEKLDNLLANPPKGAFAFSAKKKHKQEVEKTTELVNKTNGTANYLKNKIIKLTDDAQAEMKHYEEASAAHTQMAQDAQTKVDEIEKFTAELTARKEELDAQEWKRDFYERFTREMEFLEAKKTTIAQLEDNLRRSDESNETTARQFTGKYSLEPGGLADWMLFDRCEKDRINRVIRRNREWREEIERLTQEIQDTTLFLFPPAQSKN
jgi:hypothetical protein